MQSKVPFQWVPLHSETVCWIPFLDSLMQASCFSISLGDFREAPGGPSIIKTANCFSHKMHYVQLNETIVQIYPRVGEVWALHCNVRKRENYKISQSGGNPSFWLVVISCEFGRLQPIDVRLLEKRPGYRTLWSPVYQPAPLPVQAIQLFSHKVPAYKLRDKDIPDLLGLDCWDIDAAAIPPCQSFVTWVLVYVWVYVSVPACVPACGRHMVQLINVCVDP